MGDPLVYYSAYGTVRREIHVDPDNPYTFTQKTSLEYPDDFAQRNRELGEMQDPKSSMKLIARGVPLFVYEQSEREGWDEKRWAQWLNDPDNAAFRVWKGSV
jgi:hypothetical protein